MSTPELAAARLLVVEDEPDQRSLLANLLAAEGCAVATAGSLAEAVAELERAPVDLVISDWKLPDGDGSELLARIAERHGEAGFVMVTAYGTIARAVEAIHWDLAQFAGCMSLLSEAPPLSELLSGWGRRFEEELTAALVSRIGVAAGEADSDRDLAAAVIKALATGEATIDRLFLDWRGGRDPGVEHYPSEPFRALAALLAGRERQPSHPYWSDAEPCSMHIDEVEGIFEEYLKHDWAHAVEAA